MKGIPKPLDEPRQGTKTELDGPSMGETHTGITIFDKSEPRSVYNLVPHELQGAIDRVHPNLWGYSFKNLEKHAKVDPTLAQLRVAFWQEYNETQDKWKNYLSLTKVMHGICSKPTFYNYLRDQFKVAYLMYPTVDYLASMMEMQDLALREMRKILTMPNRQEGKLNSSVLREKIKIFALLENRLRGAVPRRLEHKHAHAHAHVSPEILHQHQAAPKSLAEIEKEINRIQRTVRDATHNDPETMLEAVVSRTAEESSGE